MVSRNMSEVDKTDYYDLRRQKVIFGKWIQQIAKWCWNHQKKYKNRAEQENFQMKTKAKYVIVILFYVRYHYISAE